MISDDLVNSLIEKMPVSREEADGQYRDDVPVLMVEASRLCEVAAFLHDAEGYEFDLLKNLTAVDFEEVMHVVYHLYSMGRRHKLMLKVEVGRDCPSVPSVESVWRAADWQEREVFDLFGIDFTGHPDLRRIMLPEDWTGHPLRKDYVHEPDQYD